MAPIAPRSPESEASTSTNYMPIVVGVGGGLMALFAILGIVLVVMRRRQGFYFPTYTYVSTGPAPSGGSTNHDSYRQRHPHQDDYPYDSHDLSSAHSKPPDAAMRTHAVASEASYQESSSILSRPPPYSS